MRNILRAAACAAALAWPGAALAIQDGNELYKQCRSENYADAKFCFGYIQGSMHTIVAVLERIKQHCRAALR